MVRRAGFALLLCALAGFGPVPAGSRIMFSGDTVVPRPVQDFAWHVIETRCAYQRYEREQRVFWAYDTRATNVGEGGVAYSIKILSEIPWRKSEPPAFIEMTIVPDGGGRLTALRSSFIGCAAAPGQTSGRVPRRGLEARQRSAPSFAVVAPTADSDSSLTRPSRGSGSERRSPVRSRRSRWTA